MHYGCTLFGRDRKFDRNVVAHLLWFLLLWNASITTTCFQKPGSKQKYLMCAIRVLNCAAAPTMVVDHCILSADGHGLSRHIGVINSDRNLQKVEDAVNDIQIIHGILIFQELVISSSFSNPPVANYYQGHRGNAMHAPGHQRHNDKIHFGFPVVQSTTVHISDYTWTMELEPAKMR